MLTPGIADAFDAGVRALEEAGIERVAVGAAGEGAGRPAPVLSAAPAPEGAAVEEVFGASSVVVRYSDVDDLAAGSPGSRAS